MTIIHITIALIAPAVGVMLWALSKDHYFFGFIKMLVSSGFIFLCIASGGIHSVYGWIILAGLISSWWGDLLLISEKRSLFLLGLITFFLAHVAYCVAFFLYGVGLPYVAGALVVSFVPAALIVRWLNPHLDEMRIPVYAYMVIITLMVCLAAGATLGTGGALILIGAVLFYVSDIFVARERFVAPGKINAYVGLPLYYAGQVLLAISVIYAT